MVGSIDTSEFAVGAAAGFLLTLGQEGIDFGWVAGLLIGGVLAAPITAYLVRHLPPRILGVAAGGIIVLTNVKTIMETLGASGSLVLVSVIGFAIAWVQMLVTAVRAERQSRARAAVEEDMAPV